jgi:hypothetical protein
MQRAHLDRTGTLERTSRRTHGYVLALVGLACLLAGSVNPVSAAIWQDEEKGADLWYSGFLHAEASYTDLTGNLYEFEEGYFRGKEDGSMDLKGSFHANGFLRENLTVNSTFLFDTRFRRYPQRYWDRRFWDTFRMKLVMDTPRPINDRWKFHARAKYDRLDTWRDEYPDARLLMEPIDDARMEVFAHLESKHWTFEAGDMKPDFGERGFILYNRDILGLRANAHNDAVESDLIGGRVKGTSFLQTPDDSLGLRADGTAGPYRLAHAPIVRGSEIVAVEVRDRFDPTILLSRTQQRRNIDYTVDYHRGIVTFMEPVLSETFEGDPVYISLHYSFDEKDTGYRRYIAGTRTDLKLSERVRAGVLYAGVFDDGDSWQGDRAEKAPPQHLAAYGGVLEADVFDRTRVEATAALSDSGHLGGEKHNTAVGVRIDSRSIPNLALVGDFQQIEYGYESLDNQTLTGQRNRRQTKLDGTYKAGDNVDLLGGSRHVTAANPEYDANAYTDQTTFAGLKVRPADRTTLSLRQEWRSAIDEKEVHDKDEFRETTTLEAAQHFTNTLLKLAAEREQFTDTAHEGDPASRTATLRLRGGLEVSPWSWLDTRFIGKKAVTQDRDLDASFFRRDRFEASATADFTTNYMMRGDYEKQGEFALAEDGWQFSGGDKTTSSEAYSLGADLRPIEVVQFILSYDREETRDEVLDLVQRESEMSRAEGYWFMTRDLELHSALHTEDLQDIRKIGIDQGLLRRFERVFEIDLTYNYYTDLSFFTGYRWKLRRIFDPAETDTKLHQFRIGANFHITPKWELTGRIRYTTLEGDPVAVTDGSLTLEEELDNRRWIATGEVAWDMAKMWRLALGYETLDYAADPDIDSPDDYSADRFYLKIMQKF